MAHHGFVSRIVAKSVCGSRVRDQIRKLNQANQRQTSQVFLNTEPIKVKIPLVQEVEG
jgi:hypothetical protein